MKNKVAIVILAVIVLGLAIFQVHGQQASPTTSKRVLVSISAYRLDGSRTSTQYVYRAWSDGTVELNTDTSYYAGGKSLRSGWKVIP